MVRVRVGDIVCLLDTDWWMRTYKDSVPVPHEDRFVVSDIITIEGKHLRRIYNNCDECVALDREGCAPNRYSTIYWPLNLVALAGDNDHTGDIQQAKKLKRSW